MKQCTVPLGNRSYDILIEDGLLERLGNLLRPFCKEGAVLVTLSDENVWHHHGGAYLSSLEAAGLQSKPIIIPPGEQSKSLDTLGWVYEECARRGLRRDGFMVAFGGGVVGDLCGFAAATYLRGIPFAQAPTTLLSCVDSSVGGKTAVNTAFAKNSVGAFYQPSLVAIDPRLLGTLPPRELRSGLAEVIKHGAIYDAALFAELHSGGIDDYPSLIAQNCRIKSAVVARDEEDKGERMLLNFGHSFGHAVEKKYNGTAYNHGESVAVGMVGAALIGETLGHTEKGTADKLRSLLTRHGLDGRLPCSTEELWTYLAADKKSEGGRMNMVFLQHIGKAFVCPLGYDTLRKAAKEAEAAWRV